MQKQLEQLAKPCLGQNKVHLRPWRRSSVNVIQTLLLLRPMPSMVVSRVSAKALHVWHLLDILKLLLRMYHHVKVLLPTNSTQGVVRNPWDANASYRLHSR